MQRLFIAIVALASLAAISEARHHDYDYGSDVGTGSSSQHERVSGYEKKDGTYVQPYERTKANDTLNDNYGTRGNTNPWNGKTGTGETDADRQQKSNKTWGN